MDALRSGPTALNGLWPQTVSIQNQAASSWCLHCAQLGTTCCQRHDIYVTQGDCRRIESHIGQTNFFEYRSCGDQAYAQQDDDPLWKQFVFRADGARRVLEWKSNGDCMFLQPDGCRLPLGVRPLICRLHPRLYTAAGLQDQWDCSCPAVGQKHSDQLEQSIAGTARAQAAQWHQLLYREILLEELSSENRPDL